MEKGSSKSKAVAEVSKSSAFRILVSDFGQLVKFRLTMLAVFSAAIGYLAAAAPESNVQLLDLLLVLVGGFMLSGGASIFNQVIEKDYDRLMTRTENRPVAAERVSVSNAVLLAGGLALTGSALLGMLNATTGFLGLLSLVSYAFIYTPMKRSGAIAVAVGAIPGALPTAIGVVAYHGEITSLAIFLFVIQFLWQFPHFWSIAWLADEDYKKAGFKLLPSLGSEKTPVVGLYSLIFSVAILTVGGWAFFWGEIRLVSFLVLTLAGLHYAWKSFDFYKKCDARSARSLMFSSFFHLPITLLAVFFDKIL